MRRLYSNFARGWPGVGLLIMRLVAGISLIVYELAMPRTGTDFDLVLSHAGPVVLGLLLAAGLWTPIVGALAAIWGLWHALSGHRDPCACLLIATLGVALALLGPGGWSVDARLFGWKQIDIRKRKP